MSKAGIIAAKEEMTVVHKYSEFEPQPQAESVPGLLTLSTIVPRACDVSYKIWVLVYNRTPTATVPSQSAKTMPLTKVVRNPASAPIAVPINGTTAVPM